MSKKKKKNDKAEKKAKVHKELEGFEIKINPLGEITSSYSIDQLNEFLDKNVYDKKLTDKGLEKPGSKAEDDDYHVEETEEEEENPEDFIAPAPRAKKPAKTEDEEEDETDEDEDDLDKLDDDEEIRPKKK
ncbi:hypothetical protein I5M27_10995 [Adhaeribacter sp. BT258]|uniref:Uncharacterized protein n=1 Tax=Adhaeribacter terrigena TaxID=2793070 RepID=A0ABS1C2H1_9BACT|nr:hypothetical protein [Adhaeribacter terrigena]MBK0403514.1 hypothetical protein [Adhaeribacter terrigena]